MLTYNVAEGGFSIGVAAGDARSYTFVVFFLSVVFAVVMDRIGCAHWTAVDVTGH